VPVRPKRNRGPSWVDDSTDDERRTRAVEDIAVRLKNICGHLTDNEFRRLVEDMADRQISGERLFDKNFEVS
jgi:hypothetical protein